MYHAYFSILPRAADGTAHLLVRIQASADQRRKRRSKREPPLLEVDLCDLRPGEGRKFPGGSLTLLERGIHKCSRRVTALAADRMVVRWQGEQGNIHIQEPLAAHVHVQDLLSTESQPCELVAFQCLHSADDRDHTWHLDDAAQMPPEVAAEPLAEGWSAPAATTVSAD